MKGSQTFYRNNEKGQENRLKFFIKNKERDWSDALNSDEASFYLLSSGNIDELHQVIHTKPQKPEASLTIEINY